MTLKKLIQQLKDLETLNTQVEDFNVEIEYPNPFKRNIF